MPVETRLLAGRYRVIERVGRGGMATVLLAEDERLGRRVAVKRLHADSPEETARRFRREARIGASLNHANLVSVYDIVSDDEGVLIVMEYVDGETLRDAIDRGALPARYVVKVLRGLAGALDYAHGEGIVHRDVKPANVLLGRNGEVKLADLGIATAVETTRITKSGTVMGTASYMAPEQLEGHRAGAEADIYSLAVVAWEALSGKRAYEGRTAIEIATRKASEPPPSLADAWPAAPPAAVSVLQRAMGADPAARPRTATAFAEELEHALMDEPVADSPAPPAPAPRATAAWAEPPRQSPTRRSRLAPIAGLVVALALAVAAVIAFTGGHDKPAPSSKKSTAAAKPKAKQKAKPAATTPTPAAGPTPAPGAATPAAPQQAAPATGGSGSALNNQGYSLIQAGRYAEAVPILQRAVHAFPSGTTDINYQYALFNLAHALRLSGHPAEAIPLLEQRLRYADQQDKVKAELDAAKRAAHKG